ncbi:MAG: phage terminase small subunit P27 family, partial [Candidatus Limnocylindrales bacterium]
VILAAHAAALRIYCEAFVRYVAAQKLLAETGMLVKARGGLAKSPMHQVVRDNADLVRAYARELGLTPSSVSVLSVAAGAKPTADPMAELLKPRVAR